MLGSYETCEHSARSCQCPNCRDRALLVNRWNGGARSYEVLCLQCGAASGFVTPESLTKRWWRDPGSVNVAVANRLAKRHEREIESVAEGLPADLAETVRRRYLPDTADTKEQEHAN